MTLDLWFAFAAATIFFVLLPSPVKRLAATFSLQRGRTIAFVTVPALVLGLAAAFMVALVPMFLIAFYAASAMDTLSWAAVAYLMLYVLWCFQDPRAKGPVADNDNLPERRIIRIFSHVLNAPLGSARYIVALAALQTQFLTQSTATLLTAAELFIVFIVAALAAALFIALAPSLSVRRRRIRRASATGSGKARQVFIARRAVTAGYRRIAA
jgi:homoserine/homoserine lactone efflux protein